MFSKPLWPSRITTANTQYIFAIIAVYESTAIFTFIITEGWCLENT